MKRVLVVRVGAMGDVLHALPAVAALRERHPDWRLGWAIEPGWRGLLAAPGAAGRGAGMPLVDVIHAVPTRAWKRRPMSLRTVNEMRLLRTELRAEKYDLCVDMQGSMRSSVVGWMAGAEDFVGQEEPREAPARRLYKRRVRVEAPHVVEQGCELLGAAVEEELEPARVDLPLDDAAEAWCEQLLADVVGTGGQRRFAMLAPAAGWGAKQWPARRFGELAKALRYAGFVPLVNAAGSADVVAREVVEASGGSAIAVACTVGQLTALLRQAGVMIGGDTGPVHLAAALGIPVVGLFGPTDPDRTGPYGTRAMVLRDKSSVTDHTRVMETEAGLQRVTVRQVAEAALELLLEGEMVMVDE